MSNKAESIRVTIFGEEYSVVGEDPERLREIADMVDNTMHKIGGAVTNISLSRLAILAALNIASDLSDMKAQLRHKIDHWENETKNILRLVEDALPEDKS